jgi:diguanylate cyclase (GGDEF)-like protein
MIPSKTDIRTLRGELRGLFDKAKMPTSPGLAARILELANNQDSTNAEFGILIRTDPVLSARLLKTANSLEFAQRTPVTTIERATTVVGLNRVKTISLGFQLISHLNQLGGAPFDMKMFWKHSLLRGCLARSVARTVAPKLEEEAFLVGLLQEYGIPLLVQVLGCTYASLYRPLDVSPTAFHEVERASFPYSHVDAISVMASEWKLPKILAMPLERHHRPTDLAKDPSDLGRLSAISYFVGALHFAKNLIVGAKEQELPGFAATALGLSDAAWTQVQSQAENGYHQVSALYADYLPEDVDVGELLSQANRQLASVANETSQRVLDVQMEREAIYREQQRLSNALADYRQRAALDPLTGLLNRGALTDATIHAIDQNIDQGTPIGVLFADLDNFKRLNDTYGHKVGDNVLKAFATVLNRETGHASTVGRYGGEEFVVVLRDLSADATREVAERIVTSVRTLDTNALGCSGTVTCSLGGIWGDQLPVNSAEELFAAADQVMYQAKRSGKDRCCFELLSKTSNRIDQDAAGRSGSASDILPTELATEAKTETARLENLLAIARRLNAEEVDSFQGIRKQERKQFVASCTWHYFPGADTRMLADCAVSRNISTGGVALLVDRPMVRGEPVEVELEKDTSKLYLAGLVTFCRHIKNRIHEIGVQFVTHSVAPVISDDPAAAAEKIGWVAQALGTKQSRNTNGISLDEDIHQTHETVQSR